MRRFFGDAASFYPPPDEIASREFRDPNLKLAVLGAMNDVGIIDLGKPAALASHVHGRTVDLEDEGYAFDTRVYDYLIRYPLTSRQLAALETLLPAAADEIYRYVFYFYDGTSEDFLIRSIEGIDRCTGLRRFGGWMYASPDAAPLRLVPTLADIDVSQLVIDDQTFFLELPKLRKLTCDERDLAYPTREALGARGVAIVVR